MASTIKVDELRGSTGSTVTVPTGQTLTLTDGLAVASLPTVTVAKGGTNLTSFTAGDVLYATGSTTLAKLAKGTAEQVLAMNAGASAPDWGSVDLTVLPTITVAKGGTNIASFTAGDILYATGSTTLAKLAKGTALQQIRMNAGATAPEWTTIAAVTSDYVKVAEGTITNTTNWDFLHSNFDGSTYSTFDMFLEPQNHSGTASGTGELRFMNNGVVLGGSTTSSNAIEMNSANTTVNGQARDASDSAIFLGDGTRDARGLLRATFKGLNRATEKAGWYDYVRPNQDGVLRLKWNMGNIYTTDTTSSTNGIRFQFNSATTGDYKIYGRK
tara:strand:- start:162 stop:1145 length:984 start_codon:yes stop_codon:yes gene_type:complete